MESVSLWIQQLSKGNQNAAFCLWERYGAALERLAKSRYGLALNATFDEQDLAQSVFFALWKNAETGRLEAVRDRTELWWLLLEMTRRRALARLTHLRAQKRGGNNQKKSARHDSKDDELPSNLQDPRQLPPEILVILNEEHERLMKILPDDVLRKIASWKLEGDSVAEIASKLDVSERTVTRKLNLIRERWSHELNL